MFWCQFTETMLHERLPVRLVKKESFQDLIKAIEYGELDSILIDEPIAMPFINRGDYVVVAHLEPYLTEYFSNEVGDSKESYAIAVADDDLEAKLNTILTSLVAGGDIDRLRSKYRLAHT